jgi:hypothetical protein
MNYSESDRQRLLDAAAKVVLATVTADRTGVVAYFREMMAAGRYLYDAERRYAHNQLVQQLLAGTHQGEQTEQEQGANENGSLPREQLLALISEVGAVLHDDDEGREFKEFLYGLAEHIAKASGPLFSSRISMDEASFLSELRTRLRMPESAA